MNITLTPELEELVAAKVKSGHFSSADEVVASALYQFEERTEEWESRRAAFDAELEVRIARLDRGECVTPEELRTRMNKMIAENTRLRA